MILSSRNYFTINFLTLFQNPSIHGSHIFSPIRHLKLWHHHLSYDVITEISVKCHWIFYAFSQACMARCLELTFNNFCHLEFNWWVVAQGNTQTIKHYKLHFGCQLIYFLMSNPFMAGISSLLRFIHKFVRKRKSNILIFFFPFYKQGL